MIYEEEKNKIETILDSCCIHECCSDTGRFSFDFKGVLFDRYQDLLKINEYTVDSKDFRIIKVESTEVIVELTVNWDCPNFNFQQYLKYKAKKYHR